MTYGGLLLAALVIAGAAFAVHLLVRDSRDRGAPPAVDRILIAGKMEIAAITEEIQITGWGRFSRIGLGIMFMLAVIGMAEARSMIDQIHVSVGFISSTILFGLGVALGRKRIYRVYGKTELFKADRGP